MSNGVNKVLLVGGVTKDVEIRYGQSGKAVATLRLAMSERRKDGDNWKDHSEYMDVVVWEKQAENAAKYLRKGSQVYVEGRLSTRSYKDKEGHEKWKTEVVASTVLYLSNFGDEQKGSGTTHTQRSAPGQQGGGFIDDDLPF